MKKYILKNNLEDIEGLIKNICSEISEHVDKLDMNLLKCYLYETLLNAIEHGNLNISYETKKKWIENNIYYEELSKALKTEKAKNTFVEVSLEIDKEYITIIVKDKGLGFNPEKEIEKIKKEGSERNSGRGMIMIKSYFDGIKYNETGNCITLLKKIK